MVIPHRSAYHRLTSAAEIMLIIGTITIRTDRVRPYILYRRQLHFHFAMPKRHISPYQMMKGGVIGFLDRVECTHI